MRRRVLQGLIVCWAVLSTCIPVRAEQLPAEDNTVWRQSLQLGLSALLQDELFETSQVGICVYDLTDDVMLYTHEAKQRMRPASTEKIVTAVSALSELGADHRLTTRLYFTGDISGSVLRGDLYAVGGFDPCFGRDDMQLFVQTLRAAGIDSIAGNLCADVSMKDTLKWGLGWCWDDEMPVLTPLLYEGKNNFMEIMGQMLQTAGIGYVGISVSRCPADAVLLEQCGRPLITVLKRMMKESDNLYAESVFYQLAAKDGKPYATREDVIYLIERLIGEMGYEPANYVIADGSGVSLYNYLSAELEVAFLRYAYHRADIFKHLYAVLPIAGVDGTLKNRMKRTVAKGNVHAKTGSLEGVSTLTGYLRASNGHDLAFCIMNQGVSSGKAARDFQDKVCELLCR